MIHLDMAVIVEGKYDKVKLSSIIDAVIIPTHGFAVFKDKEKLEIIRYYAIKTGIIILTDSDTAGFKIRNFLKGAIPNGNIINVYIPDIFGKEKRKAAPSKEGKLGVEGIDTDKILTAFKNAGIASVERNINPTTKITRYDFYELNLMGSENSSEKRKKLLSSLELPELLTTTAMIEILNTMMTADEFILYAYEILNDS